MEAKRRKIEEVAVRKDCCTCGESGSRDIDDVACVKVQNKSLLEIIKEVVNLKVASDSVICLQCKQKLKEFYMFKKNCQDFHSKNNGIEILSDDDDALPSSSLSKKSHSNVQNKGSYQSLIKLNERILNQVQEIGSKIDEFRGIKHSEDVDSVDDDDDDEILEEIQPYVPRVNIPMATKSTTTVTKPKNGRSISNNYHHNGNGSGDAGKPTEFPESIYFTSVEDVVAFDYILHDNEINKAYFKDLINRSVSLKHHDYRSFIRHSLDVLMTRQTQISFTFANLRSLNSIDLLLDLACEIYPEVDKDQTLHYLRKHVFNKRSYYGQKMNDESLN